MTKTLRTTALTIILAGGTFSAYCAAWVVMDTPVAARTQQVSQPAQEAMRMAPRSTVVGACTAQEYAGDRDCTQAANGSVKTVRVIAIAAAPEPVVATRSASAETLRGTIVR